MAAGTQDQERREEGGDTSGGGMAACGEERRCSDGEGRRVAARGDRRGSGWQGTWRPR
jgi:hypothetical protein